jgi:A/G-specific adenine glycosylase
MAGSPSIAKIWDPRERQQFQRQLLEWYDHHKRDLPWRREHDPYRIWVSEIMLQQTRVNAVLEHYRRFMERFPTVEKLASARESSVLSAWSGLGYYRRARMLHKAAKAVVKEHGGEFPHSAEKLRALPGIGRYTSAAVASIAFGEPIAVVDGNVERVLNRVLGKTVAGKTLWQVAEELLDQQRPGDFNQAMMELGATVCVPRGPLCIGCPVFDLCATRGAGESSKESIRQHKREISYLLATRNHSVFLIQRSRDSSLMPGMWELPEVQGGTYTNGTCLTLRHSITVTDYMVKVARGRAPVNANGKWVAEHRLEKLPLTGLARKILRAVKIG